MWKSYGTPAHLKAHVDQFHNGENCPHCGKSILNRFYLKKHLVFDHGVKDGALFCDVCPKKVFFIEGMYKKHMREKHDRPEWFANEIKATVNSTSGQINVAQVQTIAF